MPKKTNNFEKNLTELSDIVSKIESDELDIDEAIKLYKKGITLSADLSKTLTKYEDEIFELKKLSDDSFALKKSDIDTATEF